MKNLLILATLAVCNLAFADHLSQFLTSGATGINIASVALGGVTTGYQSVDTGIACTSESSPNECGVVQEPIVAPALVVDVNYTDSGANCNASEDGGDPSSCDTYLTVQITPALNATISAHLKSLGFFAGKAKSAYMNTFVSNFSIHTGSYVQSYPSSTPVDCEFNSDSGEYYGPDCHWVAGPTQYQTVTATYVNMDVRSN